MNLYGINLYSGAHENSFQIGTIPLTHNKEGNKIMKNILEKELQKKGIQKDMYIDVGLANEAYCLNLN